MIILLNYFKSHLSLMEKKHVVSCPWFKEAIVHLKASMLHIIIVKMKLLSMYELFGTSRQGKHTLNFLDIGCSEILSMVVNNSSESTEVKNN